MMLDEYLSLLSEKYSAYFDVQRQPTVFSEKVDLLASSKICNKKYFVTGKLPIWSYENYEHCLVKSFPGPVGKEEFESFVSFLRYSAEKLVQPSPDHMCSILTGCMVSEKGFQDTVIAAARKHKWRKNFLFTLHGWCDMRIVLVDLATCRVYGNKKAGEVIKFYQPALFPNGECGASNK